MSNAASRRKGHAWEREVARALSEIPGVSAERLLTETREGEGYDLSTDLPLIVQAKAGKRPRIYDALKEATAAADGTGRHPVAAIKRSYGRGQEADRFVALPLEAFMEIVALLVGQGVW